MRLDVGRVGGIASNATYCTVCSISQDGRIHRPRVLAFKCSGRHHDYRGLLVVDKLAPLKHSQSSEDNSYSSPKTAEQQPHKPERPGKRVKLNQRVSWEYECGYEHYRYFINNVNITITTQVVMKVNSVVYSY